MNPEVNKFLIDGCGRCGHYKTPHCKALIYGDVLRALRSILLVTELNEELKWSQPCYTLNGKNVLILSAFKDYAFISFFKGSLLKDDQKLLRAPGENSQAARQLRFKDVKEIEAQAKLIQAYIQEAIDLEKAGKKVAFKKELEPIPKELQVKLDEDATLKSAWDGLTPGRKRGYILHFSQPKKSETRANRVEKLIPKILKGKGFHDR